MDKSTKFDTTYPYSYELIIGRIQLYEAELAKLRAKAAIDRSAQLLRIIKTNESLLRFWNAQKAIHFPAIPEQTQY